jgi:aquaporin related protein
MNNLEPADKPVVALPFTNRRKSEVPEPKPLKGAHFLPPALRNELVAFLGEFVGTFLFLFFAFAGTQVANMTAAVNPLAGQNQASVLLYISLSFGFSLAVTVWVFFRISGGLFNPAVLFSFPSNRDCMHANQRRFRSVLGSHSSAPSVS